MSKHAWRTALAVAAAFGLAACLKAKDGGPAAAAGKGWNVYKNGRLVEWIDDKPGPLASAAVPPPGTPVPTSPFITVSSHDVQAEGDLQKTLEESKSFTDYVERIKRAGYEVKPAAGDEDQDD